MGARRIRHRCADWRGVVAAGLLLLLSGLRLPRVWLWLRLSGVHLRLRLSVLLLRPARRGPFGLPPAGDMLVGLYYAPPRGAGRRPGARPPQDHPRHP